MRLLCEEKCRGLERCGAVLAYSQKVWSNL